MRETVHAGRIDQEGVELLTGEKNHFPFLIANCYSHKPGTFDRHRDSWVS